MKLPRWSKSLESFSVSAILICFISGCATGEPVRSLCELDFERQMCWYDQEEHEGISFKDMRVQQLECRIKPNGNCLYSIDSYDLTRTIKALKK
jgi:hypothetical protein